MNPEAGVIDKPKVTPNAENGNSNNKENKQGIVDRAKEQVKEKAQKLGAVLKSRFSGNPDGGLKSLDSGAILAEADSAPSRLSKIKETLALRKVKTGLPTDANAEQLQALYDLPSAPAASGSRGQSSEAVPTQSFWAKNKEQRADDRQYRKEVSRIGRESYGRFGFAKSEDSSKEFLEKTAALREERQKKSPFSTEQTVQPQTSGGDSEVSSTQQRQEAAESATEALVMAQDLTSAEESMSEELYASLTDKMVQSDGDYHVISKVDQQRLLTEYRARAARRRARGRARQDAPSEFARTASPDRPDPADRAAAKARGNAEFLRRLHNARRPDSSRPLAPESSSRPDQRVRRARERVRVSSDPVVQAEVENTPIENGTDARQESPVKPVETDASQPETTNSKPEEKSRAQELQEQIMSWDEKKKLRDEQSALFNVQQTVTDSDGNTKVVLGRDGKPALAVHDYSSPTSARYSEIQRVLNQQTQRFDDPEEMRQVFNKLGITDTKAIDGLIAHKRAVPNGSIDITLGRNNDTNQIEAGLYTSITPRVNR